MTAINHDDVLGEDQLSQSSFGEKPEPDDDEKPKKRAANWIIFGAGGLAVLIFVGYFGWKILSPLLQRGGSAADAEMIVDAQPQANVSTASSAAERISNGAAGSTPRPDASGQYQPVAARQPGTNAISPQIVAPQNGVVGAEGGAASQPPVAAQLTSPATGQIQPPASTPQVTSAELEAIKARMDRMEQAVNAVAARMDKLPAQAAQPNAAAHAEQQKSASAAAKTKAASARPQAPAPAAKRDTSEEKRPPSARSDVQLKAVLDGRAWFQTKAGESITVGPGEEVKGLGVVDKIDAEDGKVTFTNGSIVR